MAKEPVSNAEFGVGCVISILIGAVILIVLVTSFSFKMSVWLVALSLLSGMFIVNLFFAVTKPSRPDIIPESESEGGIPIENNYGETPYAGTADDPEYNKSKALSGFNDCTDICSSFVDFMLKTQRNREFMNHLYRLPGLSAIDRFKVGIFNSRLFTLMMHDLCKCYEMQGHTRGSEILCPLLIFHRAQLNNPHEAMTYLDADRNFDLLNQAGDDLLSASRDMLRLMMNSGAEGISGETVYILADVMTRYGLDTDEYMGLLNRLTAHIEQVDNDFARNVTEPELLSHPEEEIMPGQQPAIVSDQQPAGIPEDLFELVGLSDVKKEVRKLSDFIRVQQMRAKEGLKVLPINCHCVFTGNPGTGKTTVARILGGIFKDLGILKKGHLIETDRSGLVAEYVGQTAVKTNKLVDEALDGVLFIDEAYSLVSASNSDFGKEAIATLLKRMEDDRERLVVILAGYHDEMETFINSNPGLRSRFNLYIHFDDYSADELWQIFRRNLNRQDYMIDEDAAEAVRTMLRNVSDRRDSTFGNARYVRNLFEKILENQASRLADEKNVDKEALQRIVLEDIEAGS